MVHVHPHVRGGLPDHGRVARPIVPRDRRSDRAATSADPAAPTPRPRARARGGRRHQGRRSPSDHVTGRIGSARQGASGKDRSEHRDDRARGDGERQDQPGADRSRPCRERHRLSTRRGWLDDPEVLQEGAHRGWSIGLRGRPLEGRSSQLSPWIANPSDRGPERLGPSRNAGWLYSSRCPRAGGGASTERPPPSSSGLGFRPFKAATRVRIPLGARTTEYTRLWRSPESSSPCQGEDRGIEARQPRGTSAGRQRPAPSRRAR